MSDFTVRSDSVDVEQIMRQIRARIREKRGVDYTEEEIRELANVKLEKFLDPRKVRSELLEEYRRQREGSTEPRNYSFENTTIYDSTRPLIRFVRKLLQPILKLFFNPNPVIEALHIQSKLNDSHNRSESLYYELIHNLVLETTRLGIEVKNLKMRLESISSRLDFDERRARALEGVVQYRPGAVPPLQTPTGADGPTSEADAAERRTRRRRRRGRRRSGQGSPHDPADRAAAETEPDGQRSTAGASGGPSDQPPAMERHEPAPDRADSSES